MWFGGSIWHKKLVRNQLDLCHWGSYTQVKNVFILQILYVVFVSKVFEHFKDYT